MSCPTIWDNQNFVWIFVLHVSFFYKSLCHVVHPSGGLSVCGRNPPPPSIWFLGSSSNFKQLWFSEFFFLFQNFFPPPKKFSHFHFFYAFLDVLCYPECSKNFSPKIFLGEARRDTMLLSISSFLLWWNKIQGFCFFASVEKKVLCTYSVMHAQTVPFPGLYFALFWVDPLFDTNLQLLLLFSFVFLWSHLVKQAQKDQR